MKQYPEERKQALAETSALLVLRKKMHAIWGEGSIRRINTRDFASPTTRSRLLAIDKLLLGPQPCGY